MSTKWFTVKKDSHLKNRHLYRYRGLLVGSTKKFKNFGKFTMSRYKYKQMQHLRRKLGVSMLDESFCIFLNIFWIWHYIILSLPTLIREGTKLYESCFFCWFFFNYYRCTIYQNNGICTPCSIQSIYIRYLVSGTRNNYFLVFSSAFVYVWWVFSIVFGSLAAIYSITEIPYNIIFPYIIIILYS